ncbi:MAG: J domain-containing protein [Polyangia bacterium]
MRSPYEVLGIHPNATIEEIKSAYRRCAREAHPDLQGDRERFQAVQAAYEVLGDPEKRARFEAERRAWMREVGAVECAHCGNANRITRRPAPGQLARCWHCKTPLQVTLGDLLQAQRQSLVHETARLVDEIGVDLADLAADAVRSGIGRLRQRFGLGRRDRLKP